MVLAAIIALLAATDLIVKEWIERQKPESFPRPVAKPEKALAVPQSQWRLSFWLYGKAWRAGERRSAGCDFLPQRFSALLDAEPGT